MFSSDCKISSVHYHINCLCIFAFFCSFYQELLLAKVLVPFKGVIEGERKAKMNFGFSNYVAPSGINNVVKYFLKLSGVFLFSLHRPSLFSPPHSHLQFYAMVSFLPSSYILESLLCSVLIMLHFNARSFPVQIKCKNCLF